MVKTELVKKDVLAFMRKNAVMSLATANGDKPAVAPMVCIVDNDFNLYFVTYSHSYKAKNVLKNPNCSFTVWSFPEMSVQGSGVASLVEEQALKDWVMDSFADVATRDPNFWAPIFRIKHGEYSVFRIRPTWLRVLDLSHNTVRQEESPFTEINV